MTEPEQRSLARVVGVPGAVLLGLGSILGTGVFVSLGIAAGVAGPAVVLAVVLAAGVAAANGLSSAQLAARHPTSGGTYEYGHHELVPALGFTAGVAFLAAKSASAATAALGLAGHALAALGAPGGGFLRSALAAGIALLVTGLVAGGLRRSARVNAVVVALALLALGVFVAVAAPTALERADPGAFLGRGARPRDVLHGAALVFVAYTGYGRVATLGEEVRDPRRSIPRAIVITLSATLLVYALVAAAGVGAVGAPALAEAARTSGAPLQDAARALGHPGAAAFVALGAAAAMLSVLVNLVLGLSRVALAMARRGDLPRGLAAVERASSSPRRAVLATGGAVAALALVGRIELAWSFSAFTVLVYYALTNLAALRLPREHRFAPRWVAWLGLASCAGLAFYVERGVWLSGLALLLGALCARALVRRAAPRRA